MADDRMTVAKLRAAMAQFVAERDWDKFHSPKNLSMGLAVEAAELMEHFLWIDNAESRTVCQDPVCLQEVADEMADIGCYLLALANTLQVDLSESIANKLVKNAKKYPVERYRGRFKSED
jgi:NTP pyrophosphatase (non-canonical NTP hydrolase)